MFFLQLLLDSNTLYPDFQKKCDTDWPKFLSFIESRLHKVNDIEFPSNFQSNGMYCFSKISFD